MAFAAIGLVAGVGASLAGATLAASIGYGLLTAGLSYLSRPGDVKIGLGELASQTSKEGGARPLVWGLVRPIGGNIIASQEPPRRAWVKSSSGGKGGGGGSTKTEHVYRTYAIGVCEGPISGFGRIWRNNKLVYNGLPDNLWGWGNGQNPELKVKFIWYGKEFIPGAEKGVTDTVIGPVTVYYPHLNDGDYILLTTGTYFSKGSASGDYIEINLPATDPFYPHRNEVAQWKDGGWLFFNTYTKVKDVETNLTWVKTVAGWRKASVGNNKAFLKYAKLYLGDYEQTPDAKLQSVFGVDNVSAYRGTAYMRVFDEDLTSFGGAIPQWQFEVYKINEIGYLTSEVYTSTETTSEEYVFTEYNSPAYPVYITESSDIAAEVLYAEIDATVIPSSVAPEESDITASVQSIEFLPAIIPNYAVEESDIGVTVQNIELKVPPIIAPTAEESDIAVSVQDISLEPSIIPNYATEESDIAATVQSISLESV